MSRQLIVCLLICFILYFTFCSGILVKATANSTDSITGGVRDWLKALNYKVSDLQITADQLERVVSLLSKANSSSVTNRQVQLDKVKKAQLSLSQEIQILNSTCSTFDGPQCDIPKCDSKCDICNAGQCSSCMGNWDGTSCSSCKIGWNGTNCDYQQQLVLSNNAFMCGNTFLKSCAEYKNLYSNASESGLYWIKPNSTKAEFVVYCEQSFNGGGWILITSRKESIHPYYSAVVTPLNDGASMKDDIWATVRSISSEILWRDASASNSYSLSLISFWNSANCKILTSNLTDLLLAHHENSGCDTTGVDYCLLGSSNLLYNSYIYAYCGVNNYKQWTFSTTYSYLKISNIYVR